MAASFLQYCAMCERQILTPNNSLLYCSQACHRKDSCKPLALAVAALSPTITLPSFAPSSPRPILRPSTPTSIISVSTPSVRIPADFYNIKSDLDLIAWKPSPYYNGESKVFHYLSECHDWTSLLGIDAHDEKTACRPLFSSDGMASTDSLTSSSSSRSQTPVTASSSPSIGADYDFHTRPLQSRQNPIYSASAGMTKGIDLVMPFVPPSISRSLPP